MSNTLNKIQKQTAELKAKIEELKQEAAALVKPMLVEFLTDHPQVLGIAWTQYTPYFADGDECIFRMGDPSFYFVGDDKREEGLTEDDDYENEVGKSLYDHELPWEYDGKYTDKEFHKVCSRELWQECRDFSAVLSSLEEEMKLLFEDHVMVKVTRSGVEVDEYEHD